MTVTMAANSITKPQETQEESESDNESNKTVILCMNHENYSNKTSILIMKVTHECVLENTNNTVCGLLICTWNLCPTCGHTIVGHNLWPHHCGLQFAATPLWATICGHPIVGHNLWPHHCEPQFVATPLWATICGMSHK